MAYVNTYTSYTQIITITIFVKTNNNNKGNDKTVGVGSSSEQKKGEDRATEHSVSLKGWENRRMDS